MLCPLKENEEWLCDHSWWPNSLFSNINITTVAKLLLFQCHDNNIGQQKCTQTFSKLAVKESCGLLASFHYSGQCWNPFCTTRNSLRVCCIRVCTRMSECQCVWHVIGAKYLGITLWCACQIHLSSHTTYYCGSAVSALPAQVWGELQLCKQVMTLYSRNHNVVCLLNIISNQLFWPRILIVLSPGNMGGIHFILLHSI